MDIAFEQKIRQRAYEIWMAAGMEDGDAESHWLHAERAMLNEARSPAQAPADMSAAPKRAVGKAKAAKAPAVTKASKVAKTPAAKAVSAKKTATKAFAKARPDASHAAAMN